MYVRGRSSTRHMKGKQVAMTLYLPPKKYWLLKWLSTRTGLSMQALLRRALNEVLEEAERSR
jgi:predicted DNA-binding protein